MQIQIHTVKMSGSYTRKSNGKILLTHSKKRSWFSNVFRG